MSAIESHCFASNKTIDKVVESVLSFENNEPDHSVEATINETVILDGCNLIWSGILHVKLSIPELLSFIQSATSASSITNYEKSVFSIYCSNFLFLIFGHFTI